MNTNGLVGVYGLGRFGLFWSGMLAKRFPVIAASRTRKESLPATVTYGSFDDLFEADTIFLCVAISVLPNVLDRMAPHLSKRHTVIDTCSVKLYPVEQMLKRLPESCSLVATHPMFGPDSARERADLLPIITWPVRCSDETYSAWVDHFRSMRLRIIQKSPDDHDREAAYTQGVTHYVGRLLAQLELRPSEMATLGYQRLLQVMEQTCNDPVQLFQDLQRYNPYTREMRRRLAEARRTTEAMLPDENGSA
jgi:prephenate dehydrogenase